MHSVTAPYNRNHIMKRLFISLVFLVVYGHGGEPTQAPPATGTPTPTGAGTSPVAKGERDKALHSRLFYGTVPPEWETQSTDSSESTPDTPNLLAPAPDQTDRSAVEDAGTMSSLADNGNAEKKPLSFMKKYNVHGKAVMGFGTDGLIYGGVGVSADLTDRVSINVGASKIRWDSDDWWYWPLCEPVD